MKILKHQNIRKILIINLIIILVFSFVFYIANCIEYKSYKKSLNETINKIINNVMNKYPEVSEEEIIRILNEDSENQKSILTKYGYDNEISYINKIEENISANIRLKILILLICAMSTSIVYLIYLLKQESKFGEVSKYLTQINNKNYTLKIEDNGEDEISKLRNELYKTTVLLKETAENSEKEKEQLSNSLADISHQLKTPLTSIMIMLDNITDNPNMEEQVKAEFIREISKQIEWVNSLVISLLKVAKFDAGAIKMNNKKIDIKELLENAISNLSILLEIKNIEVITNIEGNISFMGDYKWQLEAITNIIKNAVEHSEENSKIYINVEDTNLFLKIIVEDEGVGINKEDLKHIFERFYKSKNSSESSIGIGLSLARTIIEKNNGYIKVESEESKGTIFEIKYIK